MRSTFEMISESEFSMRLGREFRIEASAFRALSMLAHSATFVVEESADGESPRDVWKRSNIGDSKSSLDSVEGQCGVVMSYTVVATYREADETLLVFERDDASDVEVF
jgi:hypothetical protein